MDGDEQIRAVAMRNQDALMQRHEAIVAADHGGPVACIGGQALVQPSGHRHGDMFFVTRIGTDRTRILAAVAGIDGDDVGMQARAGRAYGRCRCNIAADCQGRATRHGGKLQHQRTAIPAHVDRTGLLQIQHDAQTIEMRRAAYAGHRNAGGHRIDARRLRRHARKIDDHTLRIGQPETTVGHLRAQLQPHVKQLALLLHAAPPQGREPLRSPERRRKHQGSSSTP